MNIVRGASRPGALAFVRRAWTQRTLATVTGDRAHYKVVVVGGGTAGINVANQLWDVFDRNSDDGLKRGGLAIVDGAKKHHYQPGWTLVGSGLAYKEDLERPLQSVIPTQVKHIKRFVAGIDPDQSTIKLNDESSISYDHLVVCPGITIKWDTIPGLTEALKTKGVNSIYSYDTCSKTWNDIQEFQGGKAIFTQPPGIIKCAGAPQKIMWMAEDYWSKNGVRERTQIDYHTGLPVMFGVKKYSDILNQIRISRNVGGHFESVLQSVDPKERMATFKTKQGVEQHPYDFLHVVPPMGPWSWLSSSKVCNEAGLVAVDDATLQSKKYRNVWSLGDASSLPTSKTAAAIMSQTPVLAHNFYRAYTGKEPDAAYTGYTSCPLLVSYGKLILAEFKYGAIPDETFGEFMDQGEPSRFGYHLKKDFFPWIYFNQFLKGNWYGRHGFARPTFTQ